MGRDKVKKLEKLVKCAYLVGFSSALALVSMDMFLFSLYFGPTMWPPFLIYAISMFLIAYWFNKELKEQLKEGGA
jgi:hypothetical protein